MAEYAFKQRKRAWAWFSQYGGDVLAKEGKTWQEILHIYFPLMEIETEDFDYI